MAGHLTTHVLDTASGQPAAGVEIELWQLGPGPNDRLLLRTARTNANGRTDASLLAGEEFVRGVYELVFAVGAYFAGPSPATDDPPFLDRVPVRFGIADANGHYHVPLLASPWSYTTYRGS